MVDTSFGMPGEISTSFQKYLHVSHMGDDLGVVKGLQLGVS